MKVGTVDGENAVTWVAAADRMDTCHGNSRTIRLEPCVDYEFVNDTCLWCGATPSPYDLWAANSSITGAWDATDAGGVHNVFRYVFNVPEGSITNPPLLSISFDASGRPVVLTPPLVNTNGYSISVFASDNLDGTGNAVTYPLDASGTNAIPASASPSRFFRLKATEQ